MKHQAVESSTIKSVAYHPTTRKMEVKFKNGTVYSYDNVPAHKHEGLMNADSPGNYLHKHINGQHEHKRH